MRFAWVAALAVAAAAAITPGRYRIGEIRVEVAQRKANGTAWDIGSAPDPALVLRVDGAEVARCKDKDTYTLLCTPGGDVDLEAGSRVELAVRDVDVVNDDPIGAAAGEVPSDWQPGTAIALAPSGQVTSASIAFDKAPPAPGWWHLHGWQLLGGFALIGLVLATAAVYGHMARKTRVERIVVAGAHEPLVIRCRHCDAVLRGGAMTCDRCGAPI